VMLIQAEVGSPKSRDIGSVGNSWCGQPASHLDWTFNGWSVSAYILSHRNTVTLYFFNYNSPGSW